MENKEWKIKAKARLDDKQTAVKAKFGESVEREEVICMAMAFVDGLFERYHDENSDFDVVRSKRLLAMSLIAMDDPILMSLAEIEK